MSKKLISLKKLLSITFAVLIFISGASISGISFIRSRQLGLKMASEIMVTNSQLVLENVTDYLESAVLVSMGITNEIKEKLESSSKIQDYLTNYLNIYSGLSGIYFGNPNGDFFYAKRMSDNSISYETIKNNGDTISTNWFHSNKNFYTQGFKNSIDSAEYGYDPRNRDWYINAENSKINSWTDVYLFSSDNLPGITNSSPILDDNSNFLGAVGVDLNLIKISQFLDNLEISKKGKVLLIDNNNKIIATSDEYVGLRNIDSYNSVIKNSYKTIVESESNEGELKFFRADNKKYVTIHSSFPEECLLKWNVVIILPESDILGEVYNTSQVILIISILLIIISVLIAVYLSFRITDPILQISSNMSRIRKFDLLGLNSNIDTQLKELKEIDSSFSNLKNGMISFSKYVPSKVVARLVSMGREAVLGGEKRELTVFFSDITNFTSISESMTPEKLVEELAEYLGGLSQIILENSGTVDKYIGDSIMAFWNAPDKVENHAQLACETAIDIQKYLEAYKKSNPSKTHFPTRIGINTGDVLVGNIGSVDRMNYTVMGDSINVGSRIEGLNKYYSTQILVSEMTMEKAGNDFLFRAVDKVCVKGRAEPLMIYELLGYKDYETPEVKIYLEHFNKGLNCYFNSNWEEAVIQLTNCLKANPKDTVCIEILERSKTFLSTPPSLDWDGVYIYNQK